MINDNNVQLSSKIFDVTDAYDSDPNASSPSHASYVGTTVSNYSEVKNLPVMYSIQLMSYIFIIIVIMSQYLSNVLQNIVDLSNCGDTPSSSKSSSKKIKTVMSTNV